MPVYDSAVPPGTVKPYAGGVIPAGYLLCDGSAVSETTYAQLFAALGYAHGNPGGGQFNLPDYRGRFLRGVAHGQTTDPDRASRSASQSGGNTGDNIGSVQDDAFQGHYHELWHSSTANGVGSSGRNTRADSAYYGDRSYIRNPLNGAHGGIRVSTETRPNNAYAEWIIKY